MAKKDKDIPVKKTEEKNPKIQRIKGVYKKEEFEAFIDLLRGESAHHWSQIANTLGVDKDTITAWKKLPQAQKAIRDGIEKALEGMTEAGGKDWRMWESKLKMLGLAPIEKSDVTSNGETLNVGVVTYQPPKQDGK